MIVRTARPTHTADQQPNAHQYFIDRTSNHIFIFINNNFLAILFKQNDIYTREIYRKSSRLCVLSV